MPEIFRTRDLIVLFKGDAITVSIDEELASIGWQGGQGVMWKTPTKDELLVTRSDGLYAGFLLCGSNESGDQYTSMTGVQSNYYQAVLCFGGWTVMSRTYEKYTYESRHSGGALVPIEYHASDRLLFSIRGLLTTQDEFSLSGDSRAPNNYYIAFVCKSPTDANGGYMTIQMSI